MAPPRPRNMVLPGLRSSYKRRVHGYQGVDEGRGHGEPGTTCLHADEGAVGIVDCAID